ncbi:MAG: hypothetical protein Q7Q71_15505 [Verrucomicrobiota bacterium JB023]|nr:hypothetical protein [Verrucomicrobiota bacterium JB023]
MHRFLPIHLLLTLGLAGYLSAQSEDAPIGNQIPLNWPELPSWTAEELEMLRSGELVLGVDLFKDTLGASDPEDLFEPLPEPEVPVEPEPDPNLPTPIPEDVYASYFTNRPAEYLIDPQGMLSMQQQKDRQSFLDYHAGDSEIDIHIYLFDTRQVIPSDAQIGEIFKRHFSRGKGLTALVYYYYGNPDRAQLVTSPELAKVVGPGALHSALKHSQEQASLKSEPASQLESFSTAMSLRLYWMEKEIAEARGEGRLAGLDDEEDLLVVESKEAPPEVLKKDHKLVLFIFVLSLAILSGGLLVAWRKRVKTKRYHFPEVEAQPLLSAPHAAGVGAVIHFDNATLPPSLQREQVPDYLRKM